MTTPPARPDPAGPPRPDLDQAPGWPRYAGLVTLALLALLGLGLSLGWPGHPVGQAAPTVRPDPAAIFAQRTLDYLYQRKLVRSGTPVVLLSRMVTPLDLLCLGLGAVYTRDPQEPLALVIVYGDLWGDGSPGMQSWGWMGETYVAFIYEGQNTGSPMGTRASSYPEYFQYALQGIPLPTARPAPPFPAEQDPLAAAVLAGAQGRAVAQSRTIDGWTITLGRVYADRNRVVLTYHAQGPAHQIFVQLPRLQTADGRPLPPLGRGGVGRSGYTEMVGWFDSTTAVGAAPEVHLQVTFDTLSAAPTPVVPTPDCDPAELTPRVSDPRAPATDIPIRSAPTSPAGITVGPFVFDLVLPVVPATPLPTVPPPIPTVVRPLVPPVPSHIAPLPTR
ncbi:MAG TPA: hypothetical protein VKY74_10475 [Chloroflexia bacterium]|nr:hypothetical protein [Chloroflexia bacterium]